MKRLTSFLFDVGLAFVAGNLASYVAFKAISHTAFDPAELLAWLSSFRHGMMWGCVAAATSAALQLPWRFRNTNDH